jgi:DNA-binding transcriptional MocR family regulator
VQNATGLPLVALSCPLIVHDSSIDLIAADLRKRASELRPGEALPSTRLLVEEHRVSPVTVSAALARLAAEGLVVTRPGAGTYVTGRPGSAVVEELDTDWQSVPLGDRVVDTSRLAFLIQAPSEGVISLGSGYLSPDLMPTRALAGAISRAARRSDSWRQPPPAGLSGLRLWFARSAGGAIEPENVVVTGGAQSALSAAFRAILPPGAPIVVESPTYLGVLAVARSAGLRAVPVPVDSGGIQLAELAETLAATGAKALYVQPSFQNPTGTTLDEDRRDRLLEICSDAGAFVVEDDFARWLSHEKPAPPPLAARDREGRVILVSSLSKSTSPSIRIGALIARGPVLERLKSLRLVDDLFVSRLVQETVLELVNSPSWTRHLKALSSALTLRRDFLAGSLGRNLPQLRLTRLPRGGLNLWVRLPDGIDDTVLADRAVDAGVLISAGRPFYAAEPLAGHIRLSFAGTSQVSELEEAVGRLGRALRSVS